MPRQIVVGAQQAQPHDERTMKASVALSFLCFGLIGLNAYQFFENGRLKRQLADSTLAAEPRSILTAPEEPSLESKVAKYEAQIVELKEQVASAEASTASEDQPNPFAGDQMREMMSNPAMKEMVKSQQKGIMESVYGDLINAFEFGDEERKHFMNLLVERQLAGMDEGMQMMSVKSVEEREALAASAEEKKDVITEQIKTFLNGGEDYDRFEVYSKQMPERQQMTGLKAAMEAAGAPLESEKVESLVEVMHEARTSFPFDHDFNNEADMDVSKLTSANVNRFVEQSQQLNRSILERAGEILDETQLGIFQTTQEQMTQMQKMSMEMAAKMFENQQSEGKGE